MKWLGNAIALNFRWLADNIDTWIHLVVIGILFVFGFYFLGTIFGLTYSFLWLTTIGRSNG